MINYCTVNNLDPNFSYLMPILWFIKVICTIWNKIKIQLYYKEVNGICELEKLSFFWCQLLHIQWVTTILITYEYIRSFYELIISMAKRINIECPFFVKKRGIFKILCLLRWNLYDSQILYVHLKLLTR